jgi:hypothetical protein
LALAPPALEDVEEEALARLERRAADAAKQRAEVVSAVPLLRVKKAHGLPLRLGVLRTALGGPFRRLCEHFAIGREAEGDAAAARIERLSYDGGEQDKDEQDKGGTREQSTEIKTHLQVARAAFDRRGERFALLQ